MFYAVFMFLNWRAGSNNQPSAWNPYKYCPNGRSKIENCFSLNHEIQKYSVIEDIETHIFCFIEIFIQLTVLEETIIYWLLCVSENPHDYKLNSWYFQNKKSKWFENLNITTLHPSEANRVVENV